MAPHWRWRNIACSRQRAIRQVARIGVVQHVVVVGLAVRLRRVRQVCQIARDRLDTGLDSSPRAMKSSTVTGSVAEPDRVRDLARIRRDRVAIGIAPVAGVAGDDIMWFAQVPPWND